MIFCIRIKTIVISLLIIISIWIIISSCCTTITVIFITINFIIKFCRSQISIHKSVVSCCTFILPDIYIQIPIFFTIHPMSIKCNITCHYIISKIPLNSSSRFSPPSSEIISWKFNSWSLSYQTSIWYTLWLWCWSIWNYSINKCSSICIKSNSILSTFIFLPPSIKCNISSNSSSRKIKSWLCSCQIPSREIISIFSWSWNYSCIYISWYSYSTSYFYIITNKTYNIFSFL